MVSISFSYLIVIRLFSFLIAAFLFEMRGRIIVLWMKIWMNVAGEFLVGMGVLYPDDLIES